MNIHERQTAPLYTYLLRWSIHSPAITVKNTSRRASARTKGVELALVSYILRWLHSHLKIYVRTH